MQERYCEVIHWIWMARGREYLKMTPAFQFLSVGELSFTTTETGEVHDFAALFSGC